MAAGNDAHSRGGALAGAHPCRNPDCMPARNAPHGDRPSSSAHDGRTTSDRACRHSALVPPCPAGATPAGHAESPLRPDPRAYAESLLAQADRFGLIDGAFRAGFQHRFGQLLRDLCRAYSGGRSASLRAETVRSISESALFAIGVRLKREESPLDALALMQNGSLTRCYDEGCAKIASQVRAAELLLRAELARAHPVQSDFLNVTLTESLPAFFQNYNPAYGAHETPLLAGYPVLDFPNGWRGIEFVQRYLDALCLENRLLRLLDPLAVRAAVASYAVQNGIAPRSLHDNLCEIALAAALPDEITPEAGLALLDRLGCASESVRRFAERICAGRGGELARLRKQTRAGSAQGEEFP